MISFIRKGTPITQRDPNNVCENDNSVKSPEGLYLQVMGKGLKGNRWGSLSAAVIEEF